MAGVVRQLRALISADTQQFSGPVAKAKADLTGFGDRVERESSRFARSLGGGLRAASGAIGAMTASVAAQEKSWLAMSTTILASFAAGGPVGAGIALAGATIGLLVGKLKEAEKASKEFAEAARKEFAAGTQEIESRVKGLIAELAKLQEALDAALGVALSGFAPDRIARLNAQLGLLQQELASLPGLARPPLVQGQFVGQFVPGKLTEEEEKRNAEIVKRSFALEAEIADLMRVRDLTEKTLALEKQRAEELKTIAARIAETRTVTREELAKRTALDLGRRVAESQRFAEPFELPQLEPRVFDLSGQVGLGLNVPAVFESPEERANRIARANPVTITRVELLNPETVDEVERFTSFLSGEFDRGVSDGLRAALRGENLRDVFEGFRRTFETAVFDAATKGLSRALGLEDAFASLGRAILGAPVYGRTTETTVNVDSAPTAVRP